MNVYDIGDTVRTYGSYTDANDVAADPGTASIRIRKPSAGDGSAGTLVTGVPTKDSTGEYHYDIVPDVAGNWYYRYVGTSPIVSQEEQGFYVREQKA